MLHGASIPFVAKLCAVAVVTTGAGVATYEIATGPPPEKAEVITQDASPVPVLAYADDSDAESDKRREAEAEKPEKDDVPEKVLKDDETVVAESDVKDEDSEDVDESDDKEHDGHDKEEKDEPADTVAPELVILHPANGSHHDDKYIVFEGETEPGAIVKAGPYAATVDADGGWRIELILNAGANRAVLSAVDAAGNVAEASVTVHLDVEEEKKPVEEEKEEEPKAVEFSANQKWGSCEEEVPYDIFWGTATPKTVVHIVSAYGSAEVEVGKHGHWEKKVYFENAPRGEEFPVVVEAVNGRAEFDFLATELSEEQTEGEHSK